MKISGMIELLQNIQKEVGDLDTAMLTNSPDGMFCFEYGHSLSIIEPMDDYGKAEPPVCVIAWPDCAPEEHPDNAPEEKPRLKLVGQKPDKKPK